jgi:myo-inositol-1-phosphate synthase
VTAFDVDERKVGLDLSRAIFSKPNCTTVFQPQVPHLDCPVQMGYIIDSIAAHTIDDEDLMFKPRPNIYGDEQEARRAVVRNLVERGVDVLVNYLPVGSEKNVLFYADCALEARCALVNAMPVFVSRIYGDRFTEAGLPILGDDIKSQIGATIIHRVLAKLFEDRACHTSAPTSSTWRQHRFLQHAGPGAAEEQKISKHPFRDQQLNGTRSIHNVYVGPSDHIPWLKDNKVCFLRIARPNISAALPI